MTDEKVVFQEVREKAKQLRTYNDTLTETLAAIQTQIKSLEAPWTSDTSDTIRAKIQGMQPKFDSYKEVIESYAAYLDKTAQQYESVESSLNSNASSQFV